MWLCERLLRHLFSFLLKAGIEPHLICTWSAVWKSTPIGWLSFCMMCDICCHRRSAGLRTKTDNLGSAVYSCSKCLNQFPPAATNRKFYGPQEWNEFSPLCRPCIDSSNSNELSSPPTEINATATGPSIYRRRCLQYKCNGIIRCHAELKKLPSSLTSVIPLVTIDNTQSES